MRTRRPPRHRCRTGLALLGALVVLGPRGGTAEPEASTAARGYVERIEAWRAQREEGLRRPAGWLSLAGLFPLALGSHTFGSAEDADLVFPASAPARVGVLRVDSTRVEAQIEAGRTVTDADDTTAAPVRRRRLLPDSAAQGPTRLRLGPLIWWVIERQGDRYLRLTDADSPVLRDFTGLRWYPVDPAWRRPARWVPPEPGRTVHVPTVLGTTSVEPSGGWLEFEVGGVTHRLEAPADEDGFFLIFGDATNGAATYGAGRFLWIDRPADGDSLFVDFNRAYNPPCAFTPFATCPLPPPGNVLPVAITAGERAYGEH